MKTRSPLARELAPVVPAGRASDAVVTEAYAAHSAELFSFLQHATRDHEVAEDLLQEAFLRLLAETRAGRTPANIRAWLYRVASNLVISRQRRLRVALRHLAGLLNREVAPPADEVIVSRERDAQLHSALARLPATSRSALLLRSHGFTGAEIAAAVGRSEAATRTLLARSRVRLRLLLEETEAER